MNIKTQHLKPALDRVSALATGRTTLPVLNCVRLEAKANTLEIAASNLDVFATAKCECDGDLEPICVPASSLVGIVDNAAESAAMILKDGRLEFISNGKAILGGIKAEEFPKMPDEKSRSLGLSLTDVADGLEACRWALSKENAGNDPWMMGAWITCKAKEMTFAASNKLKLAVMKRSLIAVECEIHIPSHGLGMLLPALREKDSSLAIGERYISCKWPNGSVFIRKIEDCQCPRWGVITDQDRKPIGDLDLSKFRVPFDTMKMLANGDSFPRATCDPGPGGIQIEFSGRSNQYLTTFPGTYGGDRFCTDIEKMIEVIAHTPKDKPVKASVSYNALFFETGDYTAVLSLVTEPKKV